MITTTVKITVGIVACVAIAGIIAYKIIKRQKEQIETETVEDKICFADIVGWFKNQNLIKGKHTAFISPKMDGIPSFIDKKGYKKVLLGVFDEEQNQIVSSKIIYAKSFDEELKNSLNKANKNGMVVIE